MVHLGNVIQVLYLDYCVPYHLLIAPRYLQSQNQGYFHWTWRRKPIVFERLDRHI